jgi:cell wall-associated NlpC family hydrolase
LWIILAAISLGGCRASRSAEPFPAPAKLRSLALEDATYYVGMPYVYGGGDWAGPRHLSGIGGIDCSGLIVNIYTYAASRLGYTLPFNDATVATILSVYSIPVSDPRPGELVFMGDANLVSHIALFEKTNAGDLYFIDAYSIDGKVEERNYPLWDPRIIQFGRMLVYE